MKYIFTVMITMISFTFAQTYCAGDQISSTHQNTAFEVCYGEYESDVMHLSDFNGATNGGHYYISFIDMAATW